MSNQENEAGRLAAIIREYWKARGRSPLVWVDRQLAPSNSTDSRFVYTVHSDMVGGWPRRHSLPSLPKSQLKIHPGVERDSPSPFAGLAGIRQRRMRVESERASQTLWRGAGMAAL